MQQITTRLIRPESDLWAAFFGTEWHPGEPIAYSCSPNSAITELIIANADRFDLKYNKDSDSKDTIADAVGKIIRANAEKFGVVVDVEEKE